MDNSLSAYGRNRLLFIGRGVAYCKSGLSGLLLITVYCLAPASMGYFSCTVDLLQPPPATFLPAHHGVLFIHAQPAGLWRPARGPDHPNPSGKCSSTTNQPAQLINASRLVSTCIARKAATGIVHWETTQLAMSRLYECLWI